MNYTNDQNSESQLKKGVDYKEEQINKLKSIKICAYWQIFGWLIFILPGFIAMILLVIKLFSYNAEARKECNSTLRIIAGILSIFTLIIGPIVAIVWANSELNWLKNN